MRNRNPGQELVMVLLVFFLAGCIHKNNKAPVSPEDNPQKGTIYISADESFRPVIEEQIRVYESSFPGTHLVASYKTEADCLKDFFRDTLNRMVIVTRGLTRKEEQHMIDSLNYNPAWNEIASDAIAVVVNAESNDTVFNVERLRLQLSGKINRNQKIVFDGLNATSTVRYIRDSILRGQPFDTSVVKAAKSSREVIEYVAEEKNAIGLVGISWIGNPEDTQQVNMLSKVKIAYVECALCKDTPFVKPVQMSILSRRYPLVRGLYYVLKENYIGLGTGFVNFLKHERGQLIFKRAYLGPVMNFNIRNVRINESLPEK